MLRQLFITSLFITQFVTLFSNDQSLFAAESTWDKCQSTAVESFNHLSVIACPLFASHNWGRQTLEQARQIKGQEMVLRQKIIEQNIQADIRIKIGVEIVSEEEVWFIPEVGFFYESTSDLEKMQNAIPQLKADQLLLYGIFQGYLSFTENPTAAGQDSLSHASSSLETLTFMSADEFQLFDEQVRADLRQSMPVALTTLKNAQKLEEWKLILASHLLPQHFFSWNLVEENLNQKFRLSTYFDYQWFSATLPDNSTLASDLIEEFEADFYYSPN